MLLLDSCEDFGFWQNICGFLGDICSRICSGSIAQVHNLSIQERGLGEFLSMACRCFWNIISVQQQKARNCWIRTLFIMFFSGRTGLGISAQALLVNLSSSGCWYEAAVESTMCVTIRGRELPSIIEFMRLDSTLTGPGFTWCISSCDVAHRTLVLLSCCNVAVLYCYSVTLLRWHGESREGECYRFHGVIPESEGSPTLPTLPDPQYLSTLTSLIISNSILPWSVKMRINLLEKPCMIQVLFQN